MNLVNFGGLIGDAIADTWMSIWLSINSMVYSIIELLYKVFVAVANVNLFGEDVFNKIVKRVYIVMAIAMLFIFAYNLVLMIINPDDKKSTGQMTKMIKETIISLVLIVLLPTIFNYMSIFQRHVLDSNILGQIILGDVGGIASKDELTTYCEKYKKYTIIEDKTDIGDRRYNWGYVVGGTAAGAVGGAGVGALIGGSAGLIASLADYFSQEYKNANEELFKGCLLFNAKSASSRGAATIAPTIFSAFYHPTKYGYFECADFIENGIGKYDSYTTNYIKTEDDKKMCSYYYYSVNMAKFTGSISAFNEESYFYSKVKKDEGTFEFNYILALVAGVLAVYMFACYTMSIGVRVAKLGFLQIISPLTVMMRIIPKKKEAIYDKWQKMLLDTYLDVFIRLLIIYFALFSISLVPDVIHTLFSSFEGGGIIGALVNSLACVIVILGILKFAQDAPGLFKEFFGGSGSFALKSPKKQLSENKIAMGGVNALRGGIYGATTGKAGGKGVSGKIGGFISGAGRGAVGGYDKAVKGLDTARTERENGSTFWGRQLDRARTAIGMETRAEADDRNIEKVFNTTERQKQNEAVMKQIKNIKSHVEEKIERENSKVKFHVADANGNIIEGNYNSMSQYLKSLQDNISNATNDADRAKALKEMDIFRDNLGQQKKQAVENMVHSLMNGSRVQVDTDSNGNPVYAFNENDMSLVQTSVAEINKEISKGGVGLQFDDQGNAVFGSETTASITSGFDLLNSFKDSIEAQSYEIQQHSSTVNSNYTARHADSRMVRGNGKSEKK